jgi:hypothetical protein
MTQDTIEFRNSSECFDNAIATGFLASGTVSANNDRWAGNWMYMYSKPGIDYFKNRDTRNYIEVPQKK